MMRSSKISLQLLIALVICLPHVVTGQTSSAKVTPYFFAVVVSNVETSSKWYGDLFGLKITKRDVNDQHGYKVFIMENDAMLVELMELKVSVAQAELLKHHPEGTRIHGHFKIGFKVAEMDSFLSHLRTFQIKVPQIWTDAKNGKRNFLISDPDGNYVQFFE
jgi:predicted enzyme related to lactoylglutathione lyase